MVQFGTRSYEPFRYPYGDGTAGNAVVNKKEKLSATTNSNKSEMTPTIHSAKMIHYTKTESSNAAHLESPFPGTVIN